MALTGLDCKMYRSTTLATVDTSVGYALMTWVEVSDVRDVTQDATVGLADVSTRATVYRQQLPTIIDAGATFQMVWDSSNAGIVALRDAFYNRTQIALCFMDGDESTAGSEGFAGNFTVSAFPRSEPLEDGVMIDVTVVAASFNNPYTVPA